MLKQPARDSRQIELCALPGGYAPPAPRYIPDLIPNPERWYAYLTRRLTWQRRRDTRHSSEFGAPKPLPDFFEPLLDPLEAMLGYRPNHCLINCYPDGGHSIGFHRDQVTHMRADSGVTLISFGAVRDLVLRHAECPSLKLFYPLGPGSAFHMDEALQAVWEHGIPAQRDRGGRISLAFRAMEVTHAD